MFYLRIEDSLEISSFSRSVITAYLVVKIFYKLLYNKSFTGFKFEANCAILIKQLFNTIQDEKDVSSCQNTSVVGVRFVMKLFDVLSLFFICHHLPVYI